MTCEGADQPYDRFHFIDRCFLIKPALIELFDYALNRVDQGQHSDPGAAASYRPYRGHFRLDTGGFMGLRTADRPAQFGKGSKLRRLLRRIN